jgi:hypothetical protein
MAMTGSSANSVSAMSRSSQPTGRKTTAAATDMTSFNPDASWKEQ